MKGKGTYFIISGVAACMSLLFFITPVYGADIVIGGDYTDIGRIVFVSPKAGDAATANGTALRNTLAGITTDEDNPYLIKLGPGTYDLGATGLQMNEYVSIEGSGEKATKITAAVSTTSNPITVATVMGINNAELRSLTVENTGAGSQTAAILNAAASPTLIHVTATASGGTTNYGIYNNNSSPVMTNVTADASGGTTNYGIYNSSSSSGVLPVMTNVTADASGGTNNYGVYNNSSSSSGAFSPVMTNVTATASGGTFSAGVYNSSSSPVMTNVTADASGGTENNYGVSNHNSSPTMTNMTSSAAGGGASQNIGVYNLISSSSAVFSPVMTNVTATASGGAFSFGMRNNSILDGTYTILIDRCSFSGGSSSISNDTEFTLRIGASKLAGSINAFGIWTCAGSYDGSYVALNASCLP